MATRLLEQYKWTKDGRKWVFYTWIPTLDGKRKKYTSPAFKTKKEALIAESEFAVKIGNYNANENMTFKELYIAYYEYQTDKVKPTTLKTYRDRVKYMSLLDNIKVKDLNVKYYQLWEMKLINIIFLLHIKTIFKNLLK